MKKLYYSIREVSEITGLKQYVLRYWETEFPELKPAKNRAGNRTYKKKDIDLIKKIKTLLYNEKFTIDGARKKLKEDDGKPDAEGQVDMFSVGAEPADRSESRELLNEIKEDINGILDLLEK